MHNNGSALKKIYRDYLARISKLDLRAKAETLEVQGTAENIIIPLFGDPYNVSQRGIVNSSGSEPVHAIKIVLCQYILWEPESRCYDVSWVSYKDFKDAAPFAGAFHRNVEKRIANKFTGNAADLKEACVILGGYPPSVLKWDYDLGVMFEALPSVPIMLLFNDADEMFPAQCVTLFECRAKTFLDMESLAIVGWLMADYLDGFSGRTFSAHKS
jgi:hypothetical protein